MIKIIEYLEILITTIYVQTLFQIAWFTLKRIDSSVINAIIIIELSDKIKVTIYVIKL